MSLPLRLKHMSTSLSMILPFIRYKDTAIFTDWLLLFLFFIYKWQWVFKRGRAAGREQLCMETQYFYIIENTHPRINDTEENYGQKLKRGSFFSERRAFFNIFGFRSKVND